MPLLRRRRARDPGSSVRAEDDSALVSPGLSLVRSYKDLPERAFCIAWSADGSFLAASCGGALADSQGGKISTWSVATDQRRILHNSVQSKSVIGLAWHPVRSVLAFAGKAGQVYVRDLNSGESSQSFSLHKGVAGKQVRGLAWSPDGSMLAVTDMGDSAGSVPDDGPIPEGARGGIGIWDIQTRTLLRYEHYQDFCSVPCWSPDGQMILTPGREGAVYVHASDDLRLLRILRGHDEMIYFVDISPDNRFAASASMDKTVRIWDLAAGKEIVTLEGQNDSIGCVQFSPNGHLLASTTLRQVQLWRCRDWERVATLPRQDTSGIGGIAFHPTLPLIAAKDRKTNQIDCYNIDYALLESTGIRPDSRRYVNAKVVLLGDTGVGKSGLGLVLSGQKYLPTDSTHGRQVWVLGTQDVEIPGVGQQSREVLLWDLAGQPGYRLVHQLHLNEIAVALVVFDSRSETDPFSGVKHWVRALAQARRLEDTVVPLSTYLVAARVDRGGVAVSRERIQAMIQDLDLDGFFETSAKEGWQITELTDAIRTAITWDALPMVSSSALFDSIKHFLVEEKKQGRVLCTTDDLFRSFLRNSVGR